MRPFNPFVGVGKWLRHFLDASETVGYWIDIHCDQPRAPYWLPELDGRTIRLGVKFTF